MVIFSMKGTFTNHLVMGCELSITILDQATFKFYCILSGCMLYKILNIFLARKTFLNCDSTSFISFIFQWHWDFRVSFEKRFKDYLTSFSATCYMSMCVQLQLKNFIKKKVTITVAKLIISRRFRVRLCSSLLIADVKAISNIFLGRLSGKIVNKYLFFF